MPIRLIIFIILHLAALIYFIEMLRRIVKRTKEYDLKDTSQRLPFGFVRLRYVVILYIAAYLVWVIVSIALYLFFIDTNSSFGGRETEMIRNVELNL